MAGRKRHMWQSANDLIVSPSSPPSSSPISFDAPECDEEARADNMFYHQAGTTIAPQPMRTLGMNSYGAPPSRQGPPRLQNANKTGLGGSTNQWGGFGVPSPGGFGGIGAAPGLGQPRPGQLSGFAQVMGGGSGQGPIDMSDFPSLSGGPRPQHNSNTAAGWSSNIIRQPPPQQPPQQPQHRAPSAAPSQQSLDQLDGQRSQQPPIDRAGGGDDFPPLGGQLNGDAFGQANGLGSGILSQDGQQPRVNGQQPQLPLREGAFQHGPQQPAQQPQQPPTNGQSPPVPSGIKKYGDMTDDERWALPGLMAAFEARRQSDHGGQVDDSIPAALRSAVIHGHDLNALGLDLDSAEPLYKTFTAFQAIGSSGSTFDFHERHMIPDFDLPNAYTVTNVPDLKDRINAFSDETLFCIFFLSPRDVIQELAATELIARDWRWHKLICQWLRKDDPAPRDGASSSSSALPLIDLTSGAPPGTQPIRTSERGEKGVYIFFDAMNWRRERRWLDLDYEHLDAGRMTLPGEVNGVPPRLQTNVSEAGPAAMGNMQQQPNVGIGSSQVPNA